MKRNFKLFLGLLCSLLCLDSAWAESANSSKSNKADNSQKQSSRNKSGASKEATVMTEEEKLLQLMASDKVQRVLKPTAYSETDGGQEDGPSVVNRHVPNGTDRFANTNPPSPQKTKPTEGLPSGSSSRSGDK